MQVSSDDKFLKLDLVLSDAEGLSSFQGMVHSDPLSAAGLSGLRVFVEGLTAGEEESARRMSSLLPDQTFCRDQSPCRF